MNIPLRRSVLQCIVVALVVFIHYFLDADMNLRPTPTLHSFEQDVILETAANSELFPRSKVIGPLDSSCRAMFDIGFNDSKINFKNGFFGVVKVGDWRELLKAKAESAQSDEEYLPLIRSLPKLVQSTYGTLQVIRNTTRLQITSGQIPYVPCKVNNYDIYDLERCFKTRTANFKKLWIVFYGDSRMRNMFYYFIKRTQKLRNWKLYKEKGKYLKYDDLVCLRDHTDWVNATSVTGDHLSYIPAMYGLLGVHPPHPKVFLLSLLEFAKQGKKLPDIFITCFGSWEYYLATFKNLLERHDKIISTWNKMRKILALLSSYMHIIGIYINRPRGTTQETNAKNETHLINRLYEGVYARSDVYEQIVNMKSAAVFCDQVVKEFFKNTNMIWWDSTLPFNLAASEECYELVRNNHTLLAEEEKNRQMPFQPFMCHDVAHKARSTIHDETTLLLNLLCNKFLPQDEYCCS